LDRGGGIYAFNREGTETLVEETRVTGNHVPTSGVQGFHRNGGGIYAYVWDESDGVRKPKFTIARSTVDGNDAKQEGGGIFVCAKYNGDFVATNSTISGNRTTDTINGRGGGILIARFNEEGETVDAWLRNVTVTQNVSASGGGVEMVNLEGVQVRIANTIISQNRNHQSAPNNKSNLVGRVIVTDFKHNLVGTGSSILDHITGNPASIPIANNNKLDNDTPGLEPLRSNGGRTPTHRLTTGSPAIDQGSTALARDPLTNDELTTDQRGAGFARSWDISNVVDGPDGFLDIGAYEIGLPKVIQVTINDTILPAHFPHHFNTVAGDGDQIRTVPVGNVNSLLIVFSENVTVTGNPITVQSAIDEDVYTGNVTTTATSVRWTLTSGIFTFDQLILRINDGGVTGLGGRLDGNWTNPSSVDDETETSTFPSGNNVVDADDDFIFHFTVLSGDFNHDNKVDAADFVIWDENKTVTSGATHSMGDANGDGAVNSTDWEIWRSQHGLDFRVWPT
jgi:hypothetical protein